MTHLRAAIGAVTMTLLLAGCVDPWSAPAGAVVARDEAALPGVTLYAWMENASSSHIAKDDDAAIVLRAFIQNDGAKDLPIRTACGEPWHSTITAANGTVVRYHAPEHCSETWWATIKAGDQLTFQHTWDYQERGPRDVATGHADQWPADGGPWTWTLEFETRDGRNLTVAMPLPLPTTTSL